MEQNENRHIQFTDDLRIHRLLNGMWQVSGAHGPIDRHKAIEVMLAYHDEGFTTWDLADHYGPAEDFIGEFRRQLQTVRGVAGLADVQALTKWVPQPMRMTLPIVKEAIEKSLRRMNCESLTSCSSIGGTMVMTNTWMPWISWLSCSRLARSSIWP